MSQRGPFLSPPGKGGEGGAGGGAGDSESLGNNANSGGEQEGGRGRQGGQGGDTYNVDGMMSIANSEVRSNVAAGQGGGILNEPRSKWTLADNLEHAGVIGGFLGWGHHRETVTVQGPLEIAVDAQHPHRRDLVRVERP